MKKAAVFGFGALIVGFLLGAWFFGGINSPQKPILNSPPKVFAKTVPVLNSSSFVETAKKVTPAVVKIISTVEITQQYSPFSFGDNFFGDDFWKRFFGVPQKRRVQGLGSGFFISNDGYIVTNNHVVEKATKVEVYTYDGTKYKAKIIGTDPKTDLALIKVKGKNFPFLSLGDSGKVQVGEWVLAIGNPLGTEFSVTAGIISAKGRQLGVADYADFIQTDAAINKGNSGGPLVNLRGEVIGVNSVILTPNEGSVGIGFAIPSNLVKVIVSELKAHGKVIRGWLGVGIQDISPEDKDALGLRSTRGALISQVVPGSPADKYGLKPYDVIIGINGKKIKNSTELKVIIGATKPGTFVTFDIIREGKLIKKKVKIGKLGEKGEKSNTQSATKKEIDLGMSLITLNKSIADNYNIPFSKGVLVVSVKPYSAADEAGIMRGDIIVEVNRVKVINVNQFNRLISRAKRRGRRAVILKIRRIARDGSFYEILRSINISQWE